MSDSLVPVLVRAPAVVGHAGWLRAVSGVDAFEIALGIDEIRIGTNKRFEIVIATERAPRWPTRIFWSNGYHWVYGDGIRLGPEFATDLVHPHALVDGDQLVHMGVVLGYERIVQDTPTPDEPTTTARMKGAATLPRARVVVKRLAAP